MVMNDFSDTDKADKTDKRIRFILRLKSQS
jgi:hypothetical protein